LYLGVWQVKTLILGLLVYKAKHIYIYIYIYIYLISSQVSYQRLVLVLVLIEGCGIASGQTGSVLQYQYPYQYYIPKLQLVYWYNTGSYSQLLFMYKTIFPIIFLVGPHLFPLFLFFYRRAKFPIDLNIEFIMGIHSSLCLGWRSTHIDVKSPNFI
jgi:hypothetical protein